MDRWMRRAVFERLEDPSGSGTGGSEEEETEDLSGSQSEEPEDLTPTEGQSPFSDPSLAGRFKNEAELAEFLAVQDSAVKSLRTRATALEQEMSRPRAEPVQEVEEEVGAQEFFSNPTENIRKVVERVVTAQLKTTVAPLLRDVARNAQRDTWNEVKERYENFEIYREATEEKLKTWGVPPEQQTPELIEQAFLAEVGAATLSGNFRPIEARETVQPTTPINPQHRPSAHPIKPSSKEKPKVKLTEEEKRLARVQFRDAEDPYAEYEKWAGFDESDDDAYILEEK